MKINEIMEAKLPSDLVYKIQNYAISNKVCVCFMLARLCVSVRLLSLSLSLCVCVCVCAP